MSRPPQNAEECISWIAKALQERGALALTVHSQTGLLVVVMPETVMSARSPLDLVSWLQAGPSKLSQSSANS